MHTTKIDMPYVRLGRSGLKGWVLEEEEGIEHIKAAYAAGINTFDTADLYSDGESERILGKAIKAIGAPRESFVILTKCGFGILPEGMPEEARANPEAYGLASLERLQVDYVDVFQAHRFDPNTPIEETMHALHDIVKAGYARYIGMSSCYAWQFHAMQNHAINNNLTPFISMQNLHSLLYREEEREMLPVCKHFGVGTIPWSPLSRGLLSRPRKDRSVTLRGQTDIWMSTLHKEDDPNAPIIDRVEEIAQRKGIPMSQVALAWLMTKDPVAAPTVSSTSLEHLMDLIKSVHVKLTEDEIKYLEECYRANPIVGH